MSIVSQSGARSILAAFALYLFVCAVSAMFFPASWLWIAGLTTTISPELGLVFRVLGAYLLSLAAGAWIASRKPVTHQGILVVLLLSQICDFFATLAAVCCGSLPMLPGIGFLVGIVVWGTLLGLCLQTIRS